MKNIFISLLLVIGFFNTNLLAENKSNNLVSKVQTKLKTEMRAME